MICVFSSLQAATMAPMVTPNALTKDRNRMALVDFVPRVRIITEPYANRNNTKNSRQNIKAIIAAARHQNNP